MGNFKLRTAREKRHWSMEAAADKIGVSKTTIARWEHGEQKPRGTSLDLVCTTFGMSAEELGFASPAQEDITMTSRSVQNVMSGSTTVLSSTERWQFTKRQAIDPLAEVLETSPEQQLGAWLAQGAGHLAPLFDEGWSLDTVVEVLRIILPIVKAMPMVTRHRLLQTGVAATMSGIPIPDGRHISEEERLQLTCALSESIATSWRLFLSASNAQILAVGQAQLSLLQQTNALLYPQARPFLYTGVYGLIGITLHFQERDMEALQTHYNGYLAASATDEPWYIAQSLICQADCYHALGQYDSAIQTIEEALGIIGTSTDEAQVRAKAHLLTCWADNAMMLEDYKTAQEKLEASGEYLDQVIPNEEFDRAGWLLLAGKYALVTKSYTIAIRHFEEALAELPEQWTLRRTMTALGLTKAYARLKERDSSLAIAENLVSMVKIINARMTNRWFIEYLQQDLLGVFSTDVRVRAFVADTYRSFPQLTSVRDNRR